MTECWVLGGRVPHDQMYQPPEELLLLLLLLAWPPLEYPQLRMQTWAELQVLSWAAAFL